MTLGIHTGLELWRARLPHDRCLLLLLRAILATRRAARTSHAMQARLQAVLSLTYSRWRRARQPEFGQEVREQKRSDIQVKPKGGMRDRDRFSTCPPRSAGPSIGALPNGQGSAHRDELPSTACSVPRVPSGLLLGNVANLRRVRFYGPRFRKMMGHFGF